MNTPTPRLTLYSRSYCHLCQDMLDALQLLCDQMNVSFVMNELAVVDVDHDPALVALYDEKVPVLVAHEGDDNRELCHYHLDTGLVRAFLSDKIPNLRHTKAPL